ncbi:nitroreductase family protein [Virgibacillus massiliensis]|nr:MULTISPECIES: nitroreductase family protein [Virgibacillus]MYL40122.1 nitroreductase family protein [Virgibacillus massiliensis]
MLLKDAIRKPVYDIDPIYTKRWSPRSFLSRAIPDDDLKGLFEAARWAPSSANVQPWRFVIARNEADKEAFLSFIHDSNTIWCKHAPVLAAVISKMDEQKFGGHNPTHAFDTGAAWACLALEAARREIITHAMAGFHKQKAKAALRIPDNFEIHAIVAIGYQGEKEWLSEGLQQREVPSNRNEVDSFLFEGDFHNTNF